MAKVFTTDNFETEVLKAEKPVLVDFWAVWCGPCQMMAPILHELETEMPDVQIGKVNVGNVAKREGSKNIRLWEPPQEFCSSSMRKN